jgi:intracellular multiplication protein IcmE
MQTVTEATGSASTGLPPLLSATQPRAVTSNFAHELAGMGYTTVELKRAGFTAKEIITGSRTPSGAFDASALLLAGYSVAELKDAGFAASQLRTAGACDITLDSSM